MTAKNFVNYHILISHSPSCLNRDDMNMQKTAVFGGKSRVRISSQSLKRAIRTSNYYQTHFGVPSVRTRNLERLQTRFSEALAGRFDAAVVKQALSWIAGKDGLAEGADAVAPWSVAEVAYYCQRIQAETAAGLDEKKLAKEIEKDAQSLRQAMSQAIDIALSGRMATSGLMTSIDGALALAHAITTHAVEPQDVDWFTAVDDLTQDAGETGAGHLDTQQFSAGVFYRYASLNLRQLQVNLGLLPALNSPETPASRAQALTVAQHLLHLLATVVPTAKQQSFAAHNPADFALVSFSDLPISLANAFEEAVKPGDKGLLAPSMQQLLNYWQGIHAFHGLNESVAGSASRALDFPPGIATQDSLAALESWIARDGE